MADIKIYETKNGGDAELSGNDVAMVSGVENTPYLAMFGGKRWCLNFLTTRKFECKTEQVLNDVTLNSAGRQEILQAVNSDLAYLNDIPGTTWTATVNITGPKSVEIGVDINGRQFNILWNPQEPEPVISLVSICPIVTGLTITDVASTSISFEWDDNDAPSYEYAYNTTGDEPDPEDWVSTTETDAVISGLTEDTEYFIFVRTVCSESLYSASVSDSATTEVAAPVLPVTSGLILSLFSSYGVETTGSDVTKWNDLSGLANHLLPTTGNAQKVAGAFGTRPAIFVDGNDMETAGLMAGLNGDAACTCFIVSKYPNPGASLGMLYYAGTPAGLVAGEFETYVYDAVLGLSVNMRGNVGFNVGYNTSAADTAHVNTIVMNFAAASGSELSIKKDDSAADFVSLAATENTNTFIAAPVGIGVCEASIGCILMYDRVLTGGEQTSTVNYLKTYFGIS